MKTHLALLRGINVSGHKLIKMEELRRLMAKTGFQNVVTYIQSGNIIFDSEITSKAKVGEAVKKVIKDNYGWDVGVLMLDEPALKRAIAENPFVKEKDADLKQLYVSFLSEPPAGDNIEKFSAANIENDEAILNGGILYLKYFYGAGKTKLSNALIESKLKVTATTRNWNTTLKLFELLKSRS